MKKWNNTQTTFTAQGISYHAKEHVLQKKNKTISDGGITVDFWFIKVHTSN